ncbi:MAG TPA: phage tail sheath subtilisin-like domain-containing protein, partial [Archangium sp.]|nr:phage tail sheath subtilisin-like domain-containing protein [Archangium sp.]
VGNGTITVVAKKTAATVRGLKSAPLGSVLLGDASPAELKGGVAEPIDLSKTGHDTLTLTLGSETVSITLTEGPVEFTGTTALPADGLKDSTKIEIVLNGTRQPGIELAAGLGPQRLVDAINSHLQGGYARLDSGGALIIGAHKPSSEARVSVVVRKNSALGIAQTTGSANVGKLNAVTVAELDQALRGAGIRASLTDGKVVLRTAATGKSVTLKWANASPDPLGLGTDESTGKGSTSVYRKTAKGWVDASDTEATGLTSGAEDAPVGDFITMLINTQDGAGRKTSYEGVGLDSLHPRWIGGVLSETPGSQAEKIQRLYAIHFDDTGDDDTADTLLSGVNLYDALFDKGGTRAFTLKDGSDGAPPTPAEYETALQVLADLENISIVAAPGSTAYSEDTAKGVRIALLNQASNPRAYRVAVLDTPSKQTDGTAKIWRSQIDSKYAALYYPWVVVSNPLARPGDDTIPKELLLPPSGFVCGIYARNDVERGVFKAPANEVVRSALRFEKDVNFAQQSDLNPLGINCLRFFPGRGYRVWGARTVSSDPEWKYLNVRRYFNFLERSIDVGTQWAVFEPNGERLWSNIRETIGSFLETQWRSGALLGSDPKQAYFVRCDRSTMTQDDLDNGRLICLVGVAVVKPAEFVIFRIGQKTADARG